MIVGNDVSVAILRLIHFQVRVLPCELLSRIYGLQQKKGEITRTMFLFFNDFRNIHTERNAKSDNRRELLLSFSP